MKKTFFLLLIFFLFKEVKAQELLNASKAEIKKFMVNKGGILQDDAVENDLLDKEPYNIMVYYLDKSQRTEYGIYEFIFFLREKKCYRYFIAYDGDRFEKELIDKFNNDNSGFKRDGKELEWKNFSKRSEVHIRPTLRNGRQSSMFMLQFFKLN